jgi:glutamyl/glutaminyl-tRNA synthetase
VQELREAGYLPAAVRNYLALLGWGADDDATLIPTAELVERFRIEDVGSAAAIFDEKKLRWVNGRYMREMPLDEYTAAVAAHTGREADAPLREACEIAQDKAQTLAEVWPLIAFLFEPPVEDDAAWRKVMKDGTVPLLEAARDSLSAVDEFDAAAVEAALAPLPDRLGVKPGRLYQPIRVAITGTSVSPGIFESLAVLGKDRSVERIERAVVRLAAESG